MVLVSRKNKKMILENLFKEGVFAVKKDGLKKQHDDIEVPNLHVMMVMKSLESKGLVKGKFNWQWHYYFLNDEGIAHLREVLHLPAQVFPATLTKISRPQRVTDPAGGEYGKGKGKKGGGKGKGKGKGKGWSSGKGGYSSGGYEEKQQGEWVDYSAQDNAAAAAPAAEE